MKNKLSVFLMILVFLVGAGTFQISFSHAQHPTEPAPTKMEFSDYFVEKYNIEHRLPDDIDVKLATEAQESLESTADDVNKELALSGKMVILRDRKEADYFSSDVKSLDRLKEYFTDIAKGSKGWSLVTGRHKDHSDRYILAMAAMVQEGDKVALRNIVMIVCPTNGNIIMIEVVGDIVEISSS